MNEEEYIGDLSDMVGVRVIIHNQTVVPTPEKAGFSVAPGTGSFVGLQRVKHEALQPHQLWFS